ncbi:hypothetical protein D3C86_1507520 [compost metagenome]
MAFACAPAIGAAVSAAGFGVAGGTLSGAAASSAGLAALGGGSIASGGLGMAGGTAVVTGVGGATGALVGGGAACAINAASSTSSPGSSSPTPKASNGVMGFVYNVAREANAGSPAKTMLSANSTARSAIGWMFEGQSSSSRNNS